jgi:hypothetical protein
MISCTDDLIFASMKTDASFFFRGSNAIVPLLLISIEILITLRGERLRLILVSGSAVCVE